MSMTLCCTPGEIPPGYFLADCAVSGEAAGTAAALGSDFVAMDVSRLQSRLRAQGVRIHTEEL